MKTIRRQRVALKAAHPFLALTAMVPVAITNAGFKRDGGTKVAQCFKDSDGSGGAGRVCIGYGTRRTR
jgi:hypothetical protein